MVLSPDFIRTERMKSLKVVSEITMKLLGNYIVLIAVGVKIGNKDWEEIRLFICFLNAEIL